MNYDSTNEMFRLAAELVNQSSRNIFLTGKAGTGKTTFLKYIRENCPKQIAVVAPTGVAAINAGGVTMHSFFQLPLSPFIPETNGFGEKNDEVTNRHSLIGRLRMTNEKKKVLQQLELLIIDEISMVRCDMMDAVDTVLRHIRRRQHEPFGGVQVLFIGDMFQLLPVIKDNEWRLLSPFYNSPYFFDSMVIRERPLVYIEFNKIYRQSEEKFITLLNKVRNNEMDEEGIQILQSRYRPDINRNKQDGYIVLTTHNEKAKNINSGELINLERKLFTYKATIENDFPETAYPADEILQLKIGAQVTFIKNDTEKNKRYYNGKIGTVTELEEEKIIVQCKDGPTTIEVRRDKWENIRYSLNKSTRQLDEEVLGSFTQYPLRLAWAITIHKSQGLTFEKAIIDAGEAFAPGQVYVALSRCTNLEGMILQSRVRQGRFFTDERIVAFSQSNASAGQLQQELEKSRKNYQQETLLSLFDFSRTTNTEKELQRYLLQNSSSFNSETFPWLDDLLNKTERLQNTAEKFHSRLQVLFPQTERTEDNVVLQERIKAAAEYFTGELKTVLAFLVQSPAVTDSKLHAKEYNENMKEIFAQLSMKNFLLESFDGKFDMATFHRRKKNFVLPSLTVNTYAGIAKQSTEIPYPLLYLQLRTLRDNLCAKKELPIYIVAGSNTLNEMARYLPQTLTELRKISGFGDAKIEQYGQQFLNIILEYCKANNLLSLIHEKAPKRERKEW